MLSASVAQKDTTPMTDPKKTLQNLTPCNVEGVESIAPTPCAATAPQTNRAIAARASVGAAIAASRLAAIRPIRTAPCMASRR